MLATERNGKDKHTAQANLGAWQRLGRADAPSIPAVL